VFVGIAFVGFLICILGSLNVMRTISLKMGVAYQEPWTGKHQRTEDRIYPIAYYAFLVAIGSLVLFVILNLS
jgi:hypothetical protein